MKGHNICFDGKIYPLTISVTRSHMEFSTVNLQWLEQMARTDGSFTAAFSNSFLSPLERNKHIAADLE